MAGNRAGGLKTAETIKKKYGEDYFKEFGKKGGASHDGKASARTMREKYGDDYYSKIGKIGSEKSIESRKKQNKKSFITKIFGE